MTAARLLSGAIGSPSGQPVLGGKPAAPLQVYWRLFAASIAAFVASFLIGGRMPVAGVVLDLASSVSCGLAWLLARALFRPETRRGSWPEILVAVLFASGVVLYAAGNQPALQGPSLQAFHSLHSLIASAVLLMTLLEALDGAGRSSPATERRFRLAFVAGYGVMLAVAVIGLRSVPGPSHWEEAMKVGCSLLALAGAGWAVRFRARHPLAATAVQRKSVNQPVDHQLALRISGLLESAELFRDPDLKVRDLARRLGEPEYKISQCITGPLGHANFNRMMNSYRVAIAKQMLSHPDLAGRSILSIAMDCGFGSIGPFNRAFKDMVGMTPRDFRTAMQRT